MKKLVFILLLLFSIRFWGLVFIPQMVLNLTNAISIMLMVFCFYMVLGKGKMHFKYPIIMFLVGIIINIFSAYINQRQNPLDTFIAFGSYYFIMFYFFLHYLKFSRLFVENIIIIFAVLYALFYVIQVIAYPVPIFYSGMWMDRGTIRIVLEGNGFLVLGYFFVLNRFLLNLKLINVILALVLFTIILMGGYRSLTLAVLFLSLLMYIKLVKFSFTDLAILTLVVLLFFGLFQFEGTSKIIKGMTKATKSELKEGDENIRLVALRYFYKEFPENNSVYILGAGLPGTKSRYSYIMNSFSKNVRIFWVDLGLLGFLIIIGVVALLGLLWYSIKAAFTRLKPDNLYLNFYFLYLLLVSIATMEIYRNGIFAVEAIVVYLIDLALDENDQTKLDLTN
jgi:hypothetical protein